MLLLTGGLLAAAGGISAVGGPAGAAPSQIVDFEGYADAAAAQAAGWFASMGDGGGAGLGIQTITTGDALAFPDQYGDNNVLSIGWNTAAGWAAIGQNLPANADWSAYDGVRFWLKGSDNGGSFNFELQTDNGDSTTAMAHGSAISDDTSGWTLISVPFSSLTNGYGWNAGGSTLDLTQVKAFLFSGFVGADNNGAKIDQFELYNTGDPETPMAPTTTTAASSTTEAPSSTTTTTEATTTTSEATTTTTEATTTTVAEGGPRVESLDSFDDYPAGDSVPSSWFNYGNAGGGVEEVPEDGARAREDQTGTNKILAWGFDAESDPGYGGIGKEYTTPANFTGYTGIQFWFYGSGEGGELQVEIGEDKTDDVERYRSAAFNDDQEGWRLIKLPFSSFGASEYNPQPGNGRLDLTSVSNVVFAANAGSTTGGVALDDLALYFDGSLPATGASNSQSTSTTAIVLILLGVSLAVVSQSRRTIKH